MSKLTAAYVAGLVDGEGSLGIQKEDRKYQARIRVCMTDEFIIKWLYESFGGYFSTRTFNNDKWKTAYEWDIHSNRLVKPFLDKIYPYLRVKKKQAEVIKEFQRTFNNSFKKVKNKSEYHNGHHLELKDETIKKRYNLYLQIKELNKKGKFVQPERLSKVTSEEEAIV